MLHEAWQWIKQKACVIRLAVKQPADLDRKPNEGTQQIFNALLLAIEGVDNESTYLNALDQLGDDYKVKDQRRRQILHRDALLTTHEELKDVIVPVALRIARMAEMFDDYAVVRHVKCRRCCQGGCTRPYTLV